MQKNEHIFVYGFEKESDVSKKNIAKITNVIEKRLNKYGLKTEIVPLNKNSIQVKVWANELKDERVDKIILNQGKLEFWHVCNTKNFAHYFHKVDDLLDEEIENDSTNKSDNVFNDLLKPVGFGDYMELYVNKTDTLKFRTEISTKEFKSKLPTEMEQVKFLFGPGNKNENLQLYIIEGNKSNIAYINGSHIVESFQNYDVHGKPSISIKMNEEGAKRWEQMTGKASDQGGKIAITLNDIVYSAPGLSNGAIKGGVSEISGNFTLQEAQDLAVIFASNGSIPKLKLLKYSGTSKRF